MADILTPLELQHLRANAPIGEEVFDDLFATIDALAEALRASHSMEQYGGVRRHEIAIARVAAWMDDTVSDPAERLICQEAAQIVGLTAALVDDAIICVRVAMRDGHDDRDDETITALRKLAEMLTDE